jgi:glycosyltransferase involved in cell wall biosynthesis
MTRTGARIRQYDAAKDFGEDFPNSIHEMLKNLLIIKFDIQELLESRPWLKAMKEVEQTSDVVWYEWANRNAVFGSQYTYPNVRKVIRLHSYELMIPQIPLIDWSNIDEVIVVSPMMEKVFRRCVPSASHVEVKVIPNYIDWSRFVLNKSDVANENIGLIGWAPVAKDLAFALNVIEELNNHGTSFKLHLFGGEPDYEAAANKPDVMSLYSRLDLLVDQGIVVKHGWVDHIENELEDIGFILSTSSRESFHLGLFEGVLSGAIPVVRQWPFWGDAGSPLDFMPHEWVVSSPKKATKRILEYQDNQRFNDASEASAKFGRDFFASVDYDNLYKDIWEK